MSKINVQDQLLHQARKERLPVKIFLMKGLQLQGRITGYDMYSVLLEGQGRVQLIFKHAISTIEFPEKLRINFDPDASPAPKAGATAPSRSAARSDGAEGDEGSGGSEQAADESPAPASEGRRTIRGAKA